MLQIEDRGGKRWAVAIGPWCAEATRIMRDGEITGLELNYAKGWPDEDIDFLRDLGWVESPASLHASPKGIPMNPWGRKPPTELPIPPVAKGDANASEIARV